MTSTSEHLKEKKEAKKRKGLCFSLFSLFFILNPYQIERGRSEEGIVRLIWDSHHLRTTRLNHHQHIRRSVVSGRGVDDNSRLETLTIHPSGQLFLLSSIESALIAHVRSSRFYDCALLLRFSRLTQKLAFAFDSPFLPPLAISLLRTIKKENLHQSRSRAGSPNSTEVSRRLCIAPCIASIDTKAKVG